MISTVHGGGQPDSTTEAAEGPTPAGGTVAAARAADVLLAVASARAGIGVTDISRRLEISKAVVHRVLQSLASRRLVRAETERGAYTLGPAAAALGARALGEMRLRRLAMPLLRELQAKTGETATVSALLGADHAFLDQVVSSQGVRMTVELGRPCPLYAGASGRAILAVAPADLRRRVLDGERAVLTAATVTDREALERLLEETRRAGCASSFGERQDGSGAVAAPVYGPPGEVVGAIGVCGPATRLGPAEAAGLAATVREAAEALSAGLGAARLG